MSKPEEIADVTVVVPAYNAETTIRRALQSVLRQTLRPLEIVVVDDGSTDRTRYIIEDLQKEARVTEIILITQENEGAGAARNRALSVARGAWLAFLDADDEWMPEKLRRSLEELRADSLTLVAHDMLLEEGGSMRHVNCARHAGGTNLYRDLFIRGFIATSTVVVSRELVEKAGRFNPALRSGQDYELWLRVFALPECRAKVFGEALTLYHVTQGSISSSIEGRRQSSLEIVRLQLATLRGRSKAWFTVAILRVAIVHYEAVRGEWLKGRRLAAIRQACLLPLSLLRLTAWMRFSGSRHAEANSPFLKIRRQVETQTSDPQLRNRLWWEAMPMTYQPWDIEDRKPPTDEELLDIERTLLTASPFLRMRFPWSDMKGLRVADIGCGSGALSIRLARFGANVTAVDLTETATSLTKRYAAAASVPVSVVRADAERLPIKAGAFDFVLSWGVLHHTSDMDRALQEVARVLRSGGRGLIMIYHRRSLVYFFNGLRGMLAMFGRRKTGFEIAQDIYTDGYYHRYLRGEELSNRLAAAGLATDCLSVTQFEAPCLPVTWMPKWLDEALKARYGMLLIAEFGKP